ncbi:tetratricopeptide repeat protein, partial [Rhizobium johnstonii]|uniref:tetratricopeptide repeat protein n=1 Tax=Rhizobium johnstonii TaxID=3019933 RepID=UPI003F9E89F2
VIAFVNGRPDDGFMGAVPESQIQQFIDRIAGPAGANEAAEIEAVVTEAAELLAAGNINEAAQLYGAVIQADPENAKALAGMAECMIAANQHQRAREILTELPEELAKDTGIQAVLM